MGRSPPARGAGPPIKGQQVSTVNRNVNSPPVGNIGGVSTVRKVPTNPARKVPTSPQPSRLGGSPPPPLPPSKLEQRRKIPKISEYSKKKIPDKTSAYGKKKEQEMKQPGGANDGTATDQPDPSKRPEPELARQFNKVGFEVLDHLGSGAYAEVWKVKNLTSGKMWAAKVISVNK